MTPSECVQLCQFISALSPAQKFDEFTPDAWFAVLGDLNFQEAKDAVVGVKLRERWIDPTDIRFEVKRARDAAYVAQKRPPCGLPECEVCG